MKMLMFDFRESERKFFERNKFDDFEIEFIKEPLNAETQLSEEQLNETVVISVFISSDVNEEVIKRFKNLRMISTRSTGYNHIDLQYCTQHNIAVFNVAEYGSQSVAQYTFMLIIALVRKFLPAYLGIKKYELNYQAYEGRNLEALSIGIVGGGSIGGAVAKIANYFGMKVYVCSYEKKPEIKEFAEYVSMDKLLSVSDIITLHIPYNSETHHIISDEAFFKMKDGVYLINTARGELVDIISLYNNLLSGKLSGVALDVFECENIAVNESPVSTSQHSGCFSKALILQKLLSRDDVIITPHIAYNTKESVETILKSMFISLRDYTKGLHTNQIR